MFTREVFNRMLFVSLFGLFGIIVFLIIFLSSKNKKNERKASAIGMALCFCVFLFGCVSSYFVGPGIDIEVSFGDSGSRKTVAAEKSVTENSRNKKQNPGNSVKWSPAGTYKIGTDLDAGTYYLREYSDSSCAYYEVDRDSEGNSDSIIDNEVFENFAYISVTDGQYLDLSGCEAIPLKYAPKQAAGRDGNYTPGMYLVGRDISQGEYKLIENDGELAYYEILPDCKPSHKIVTNDAFKNTAYITVKNGQYLAVKGATFCKSN